MNNPLVSVVIITRNREKELQRCIKSILNNTYENIEIIILDNSSRPARDMTRDFIASLKHNCNIKYKETQPKGFAELRQESIENSKGEIIMSIDDDCVADRQAISQIVERFMSDEKIGIVGGTITNVGFDGYGEFKGRGKIGLNGQYENVRDPKDAEVFGSANMSIRIKAFDEVGGYDLFFSGGLEEADLTFRVRRKGYKIVYEPSVRITHFYSSSKFRIRSRNMHILRLYLFFKHYMPKNAKDWVKFFKSELKMLLADINSLLPKWTVTGKGNIENHPNIKHARRNLFYYPRKLYRKFRQLIKILIPRIIIPHLIYKARKVRTSEQKTQVW